MYHYKSCFKILRMVPVLALLLLPLSVASASTYKVLYRFSGGSDGGTPNAVFRLTPADLTRRTGGRVADIARRG